MPPDGGGRNLHHTCNDNVSFHNASQRGDWRAYNVAVQRCAPWRGEVVSLPEVVVPDLDPHRAPLRRGPRGPALTLATRYPVTTSRRQGGSPVRTKLVRAQQRLVTGVCGGAARPRFGVDRRESGPARRIDGVTVNAAREDPGVRGGGRGLARARASTPPPTTTRGRHRTTQLSRSDKVSLARFASPPRTSDASSRPTSSRYATASTKRDRGRSSRVSVRRSRRSCWRRLPRSWVTGSVRRVRDGRVQPPKRAAYAADVVGRTEKFLDDGHDGPQPTPCLVQLHKAPVGQAQD